MNTEEFIHLSINPNQITKDYVIALESVLEEFPYFQTAQVLYLKGLKNQKSFKYNNALKRVAAHSTNRTVLFDFITTDVLDFEKKSKLDIDLLNSIDVVDSVIIERTDELLVSNVSDTDLVIDETKIQELLKIKADLESQLKAKEKELELGTPINFEKTDEFSFNEWLDLPPKKQIDREKEVKKAKNKAKKEEKTTKKNLAKQVDLIEEFILKKPKLKPSKTQEIKDISADSVKENTNLMTETLARVYIEQKKYDKAILAFRILSLKYPEKSSFFADRIKAIKFLQKHKS